MLNIFNKRFITQQKYDQLKKQQVEQLPALLEALAKHGIKNSESHRLRFYFYTNSEKKSSDLISKLKNLGYETDPAGKNDRGEFSIKGISTLIKINKTTLEKWTLQMLEIGFKNDCEFDGFEVAAKK